MVGGREGDGRREGEGRRAMKGERGVKAPGTCILDRETVRDASMQYYAEKRAQHRLDGKVDFDMEKIPASDLLEGRETFG